MTGTSPWASSIASGYGIANQSTFCGRSDRELRAGHFVAATLGLNLTDVSCGAAVIPNVLDRAQGTAPRQIDAVTPDTKLITVSVGGNDINLNGTALGCGNPATGARRPRCSAPTRPVSRPKLVAMLTGLKGEGTVGDCRVGGLPTRVPGPELRRALVERR